jgi:hypothetical protein
VIGTLPATWLNICVTIGLRSVPKPPNPFNDLNEGEMSLVRSVAGGWRCLSCDGLFGDRFAHNLCPEEEKQVKLTGEEDLLLALADIADFKPTEGNGEPHTQIAVYARERARRALTEWRKNDYVPQPNPNPLT